MKWSEFFKNQFRIGVATTIPFIGVTLLELYTEDRILNSYDSLEKRDWFPPKWIFWIMRNIMLWLIGYGSYLVWMSPIAIRFTRKLLIAYSFYFITLLMDWSTIFLSPTKLNFAAVFYATIIIFAFISAFLFQYFHKYAGFCFVPYILWLMILSIIHFYLFIDNSEEKWFYNYDSSLNVTQKVVDKHVFLKMFGLLPRNYTDKPKYM